MVLVEHNKTKLYQRENCSKNFLEISEEQLLELSKKVYRMQEKTEEQSSLKSSRVINLERYQRALLYLTSPQIHLELKTFDERMAYLIMMADPNLVTFKEFLKLDLISISEISKVEDEKERNRLKEMRKQTIATYETIVREKIGFFDVKLLKYEELFFKRFFSEKELITEVGNNNHAMLMLKAKTLKNFNGISDERFDELTYIAQTWHSLVQEKNNLKVAAYSVANQKQLLGINTSAEQLALFILLMDSELDMLRIYEEESMIPNVRKRIIEQFGYYSEDLLSLERKFHDRFCPDKQISEWSDTKKAL